MPSNSVDYQWKSHSSKVRKVSKQSQVARRMEFLPRYSLGSSQEDPASHQQTCCIPIFVDDFSPTDITWYHPKTYPDEFPFIIVNVQVVHIPLYYSHQWSFICWLVPYPIHEPPQRLSQLLDLRHTYRGRHDPASGAPAVLAVMEALRLVAAGEHEKRIRGVNHVGMIYITHAYIYNNNNDNKHNDNENNGNNNRDGNNNDNDNDNDTDDDNDSDNDSWQ